MFSSFNWVKSFHMAIWTIMIQWSRWYISIFDGLVSIEKYMLSNLNFSISNLESIGSCRGRQNYFLDTLTSLRSILRLTDYRFMIAKITTESISVNETVYHANFISIKYQNAKVKSQMSSVNCQMSSCDISVDLVRSL